MKLLMVCLAITFVFPHIVARSQDADPYRIGIAALELAAHVIADIRVKNGAKYPPDQIIVSCSYSRGCNGAEVILSKLKGDEVARQTISAPTVTFSALKTGKYRVEISYARYSLPPTSVEASTGSYVSINLKEQDPKAGEQNP